MDEIVTMLVSFRIAVSNWTVSQSLNLHLLQQPLYELVGVGFTRGGRWRSLPPLVRALTTVRRQVDRRGVGRRGRRGGKDYRTGWRPGMLVLQWGGGLREELVFGLQRTTTT